jgi:Mce-associated membrane protein
VAPDAGPRDGAADGLARTNGQVTHEEELAGMPAPADEAPAAVPPAAMPPAAEALAGGPAADEVPAGGLTEDDLAEDEPPAAEPATGEPPAEEPAAGEPPRDRRTAAGPRLRIPLLPAALGVLAVILGGLAVWFGLEAGSATSGVDTANIAMTDQAATSQVRQQIASAVDTIFSYNYANTAKTSQAAAAVLTGQARGKYNTLFRLVRLNAPKEKLVVTTTVTNSGVEYLNGGQARVLIFANQRVTAGVTQKTTEAGAMFAVNAVYLGGRWKIAYIDTFGAGG